MLFYFNFRSENVDLIDREGMELPSLDAARREANRAAKQMASELVQDGSRLNAMRLEIVDDSGTILATQHFRDIIKLH